MGNGFFNGRNGSDQLSVFLVGVALVTAVAASVWAKTTAGYVLVVITLGLVGWAFFRILSTDIGKRRNENEVFLSFFKSFKSDPQKAEKKRQAEEERKRIAEDKKTHAYFKCPECHTTCRVPKGKGKIRIKCPKRGHQFIKRT